MSQTIHERLNQIPERILSTEFLTGQGLGNEIGFWIFDYAPEDELKVREYLHFLDGMLEKKHSQLKVVNINLLQAVVDYLAEGNLHAQDFGAVEQALGVFLQAENGGAFVGLVSAHALESAATIVQGVRENVHLGIAPVNQLAIHPDGAIAVRNGRNCAHAKKSLWVERPIHDLLFPLKRS